MHVQWCGTCKRVLLLSARVLAVGLYLDDRNAANGTSILPCKNWFVVVVSRVVSLILFVVRSPQGTVCDAEGVTWESLMTAPGWWRANGTDQWFRCILASQCTGGLYSSCAPHRIGVLCALCEPGYAANTQSSDCTLCPQRSTSIGVSFLLILVIVGRLSLHIFRCLSVALRSVASLWFSLQALFHGHCMLFALQPCWLQCTRLCCARDAILQRRRRIDAAAQPTGTSST